MTVMWYPILVSYGGIGIMHVIHILIMTVTHTGLAKVCSIGDTEDIYEAIINWLLIGMMYPRTDY